MVRAPTKTCPGLSRLLSEGPPDLIAKFLGHKSFEKLD